ncbi:tripartite tricarboxylate transporter TctB family protein [Paenibacillus alginolyticus]|uniref:tripartite tricarboxylate transporter TctB family protein n=1 Tax=Paenibacillus alginolyticus TaxID=59839 RepID=UPI000407142E|nr:tripartite tricarboxylate transporter TctB family protein [Paenibacillus alginolyticus]MCY9667820.1 tripartite tricarboxylate transporter TctB family protein [Paenibacillus alginolyticus]
MPDNQLKGRDDLKNVGVCFGIFIFLLGCMLFWQALSLDYKSSIGPGPGLFPLWLSGILIILSILYIVESIKKEVILISDILPKGKGLGNVISILFSSIIFIIVVSFAGFVIAGTLLMFMLLVREYKWYRALGISFVIAITTFVVFQTFLDVPLPVNEFGF